MAVTQKDEPKAETTRPKPTPKPPKPVEKPKTFKFISSLFMVNPFSGDRFQNGEITEVKEIDGWVRAQQEAGILKPIE